MIKKTYSVIIPNDIYPLPTKRELSAAQIIAEYFRCNVTCVARSNHKTADFLIRRILWELKTPTGTGKYNIQHALQSALKQSQNIIIDARFSKLHITKITNELRHQAKITKSIKHLLLINKYGQVIEIV